MGVESGGRKLTLMPSCFTPPTSALQLEKQGRVTGPLLLLQFNYDTSLIKMTISYGM